MRPAITHFERQVRLCRVTDVPEIDVGEDVGACEATIYEVESVDATYEQSLGVHPIEATVRRQTTFYAAGDPDITYKVGDVVVVGRKNNRLWILNFFMQCIGIVSPCPSPSGSPGGDDELDDDDIEELDESYCCCTVVPKKWLLTHGGEVGCIPDVPPFLTGFCAACEPCDNFNEDIPWKGPHILHRQTSVHIPNCYWITRTDYGGGAGCYGFGSSFHLQCSPVNRPGLPSLVWVLFIQFASARYELDNDGFDCLGRNVMPRVSNAATGCQWPDTMILEPYDSPP